MSPEASSRRRWRTDSVVSSCILGMSMSHGSAVETAAGPLDSPRPLGASVALLDMGALLTVFLAFGQPGEEAFQRFDRRVVDAADWDGFEGYGAHALAGPAVYGGTRHWLARGPRRDSR